MFIVQATEMPFPQEPKKINGLKKFVQPKICQIMPRNQR